MTLSLIVAAAENGVIGRDNDLPWSLPDDMQFFRETTKGKTVITGRKNHEAMGRLLPGRRTIIITRQPDYVVEGAEVVHSLEEALEGIGETDDEIFVIGGGEVYRQALPKADRVYLTRIHAAIDGDVTFPDLPEGEWKCVSEEHHPVDDRHAHSFTFQVFERKSSLL